MKKIAILVADSQHLVAESLARALDFYPGFVTRDQYPSGGFAAVAAIELLKPDVAIVDYWLSDIHGPGLVRAVGAKARDCRVIVTSWMDTPREIENTIHSGAVGFFPKRLRMDHLAEAIHRARAGESFVYAEGAGEIVKRLQKGGNASALLWNQMRALTGREIEILALLGGGKDPSTVAAQLSLSKRTVTNYLQNIRTKTGARSLSHLLAMARRCDLIAA